MKSRGRERTEAEIEAHKRIEAEIEARWRRPADLIGPVAPPGWLWARDRVKRQHLTKPKDPE
jgi:hypothetical protein